MGKLNHAQRCECGSQVYHINNHIDDRYSIGCQRRQHEKTLGKAWMPSIDIFLCGCGGLTLPLDREHYIQNTEVVLSKEFACPVCSMYWSLVTPPDYSSGVAETHPAMARTLTIIEHIGRLMSNADEEVIHAAKELRTLSELPRESPLALAKRVFRIGTEYGIPDSDLPERKLFLEWVDRHRNDLIGTDRTDRA